MKRYRDLLLLLALLLVAAGQGLAQERQYQIAAEPTWIKPIAPDYGSTFQDSSAAGSRILLLNRQHHMTLETVYSQFAVKILTADALRDLANLTFDFDPAYQTLILHSVAVRRDGREINRLDPSSINVIKRETGLAMEMYDGNLTAVINLKDVRIGDVVEYAYSIKGRNPVFRGHVGGAFYLQYTVPIDRLYYRYIAPNHVQLNFRYFNDAARPTVTAQGSTINYVWDLKEVPTKVPDSNIPFWYDPYPEVSLSNFSTWQAVIDWGRELFSVTAVERARLRPYIDSLVGEAPVDSIILRATRFVQDEIRYLAFLDGMYSHQPRSPVQIIEQRYGDCKEKSLLLCEILRANGITADPMLVHSTVGRSLPDYPPSAMAFDHCVVHIEHDGGSLFIDPTISSQGGDLEHLYFPDYHNGLILSEAWHELVPLPSDEYSKVIITETFDLGEPGQGTTLEVVSEFVGMVADQQRQFFSSIDPATIQQSYTEYYSAMYPSIEVTRPLEVTDQREGDNRIVVKEQYRMDSVWLPLLPNSSTLACDFYPLTLAEYMDIEQSPARTMPYRVDYPIDISHETVIRLASDWTVQTASSKVERDAFTYENRIRYRDRVISILHTYKTHVSSIPAEAAPAFIAEHNSLIDELGYQLTYDPDLAGDNFAFSWGIGLITLLILGGGGWLSVIGYRRYDIKREPGQSIEAVEPRPIGGWLALLALGFTLQPVRLAADMLVSQEYYNSLVWQRLVSFDATTRELLTGILMFSELVFNNVLLVAAVFAVILLYKRRAVFPRFAIMLLLGKLVFVTLDTLLAFGLNPDLYSSADRQASIMQIVGGVIESAIWVPYLLVSKRVKATFVVPAPSNRTTAAPDQQPLPRSTESKAAPYWLGIVAVVLALGILGRVLRDSKTDNATPRLDQGPVATTIDSAAIAEAIEYEPTVTARYAILQCVDREPQAVHIRIITVPDSSSAAHLHDRLLAGEDFASLAREASVHATAALGGDLGSHRLEDLSEQFQTALADAGPGDVTAIIALD